MTSQGDITDDIIVSLHQDKVKTWLNTALKKEEETWLRSSTPELIDQYYFSPLAVDVIQVRTDTGGTEGQRNTCNPGEDRFTWTVVS